MLHDLVIKAAEEPSLVLTGAGGGALLMFFVKEFFRRTNDRADETRKMLLEAVKSVGQLEAARDRAREKDDELAERIKALEIEVREAREEIIVLKARGGS